MNTALRFSILERQINQGSTYPFKSKQFEVNNLEKARQELKGSLLQEIIDWQARALSIAYEIH
jgi:hypothetical protein